MNNIALGRYIPLDSWMHKIDPRFKLIGMLIMLIAIFLPAGWQGYLFITVVLILGLMASKLKLKFIYKSFKPMLFMMLFLLVINILMIREGEVLWQWWKISIYSGAINQTAYIAIRLILMITVTTILTATTKPLDMTLGIEDLLKPFAKIGVPAHEIALMISIALRFIPTLIEEAQRIMKAQSSRGVDFDEGSFKEKITGILSLIVPLFVSSFERAEDLAEAMEARGFSPSSPRTRYKQLILTGRDYLFLFLCLLVLVGVIVIMYVF